MGETTSEERTVLKELKGELVTSFTQERNKGSVLIGEGSEPNFLHNEQAMAALELEPLISGMLLLSNLAFTAHAAHSDLQEPRHLGVRFKFPTFPDTKITSKTLLKQWSDGTYDLTVKSINLGLTMRDYVPLQSSTQETGSQPDPERNFSLDLKNGIDPVVLLQYDGGQQGQAYRNSNDFVKFIKLATLRSMDNHRRVQSVFNNIAGMGDSSFSRNLMYISLLSRPIIHNLRNPKTELEEHLHAMATDNDNSYFPIYTSFDLILPRHLDGFDPQSSLEFSTTLSKKSGADHSYQFTVSCMGDTPHGILIYRGTVAVDFTPKDELLSLVSKLYAKAQKPRE